MGAIKAGVVCITKFCKAHSSQFESYINYIDRDEATRNDNSMKYNLYQDYMGDPNKTSSLFTESSNALNQSEKQQLKELFQTAQDNGSLMWQTVISFDNRWLAKNGLYRQEEQMLDEDRLKGIVRSAVRKMLKAEKLENAVWSAAIHFNTDNIHVHVATVEPDPMREKREYIQYEEKMVDGKKVKEPIRDSSGQIVKKEEYKGTFKPKSIELCKSSIVNEILNERESNLQINQIIRESIVKQKKEHPLSKDKDLANVFLNLYEHMPNCAKNMWNYNNPIMAPVRVEIDQLSNMYLDKYHKEELEELKQKLKIQDASYKQAYGNTGRSYYDGKMQDMYARLGNAILKEVYEYDKEIKLGATNGTRKNNIRSGRTYNIQVRTSLASALNRMKKGLKDEWQKRQNIREHEQLMEQGKNQTLDQNMEQ